MNLDSFISETLKSIIKAVNDTQDFANKNGSVINPHIGERDKLKMITTYYFQESAARAISTIDFDVAVTASNEQESGAHGGINVLSLKIGGNLSDKEIRETVSRVKFSINVVLPGKDPNEQF